MDAPENDADHLIEGFHLHLAGILADLTPPFSLPLFSNYNIPTWLDYVGTN